VKYFSTKKAFHIEIRIVLINKYIILYRNKLLLQNYYPESTYVIILKLINYQFKFFFINLIDSALSFTFCSILSWLICHKAKLSKNIASLKRNYFKEETFNSFMID